MKQSIAGSSVSRRAILGTGVLLPMALNTNSVEAAATPPPYTLSVNIEIMFPNSMSRDKRMEVVAAQGAKAFSFWAGSDQEERAMLAVQQRTGMKCASLVGSPSVGWSTGLTKTGMEKQYLEEITARAKVAKSFGGADGIIFAGAVQKDIPWETQRQQIVSGLRKAGDIAGQYGMHLVLEPLNRVESPQMSVLTARDAFAIVDEVAHPNVKVCFDMYHLQLSEGNLTNNLKLGLSKGWIRLVQIGDVPGRKEPGTGETNYAHIFHTLRQIGYTGYVDTEHGTTTTPEQAIALVRRMMEEN